MSDDKRQAGKGSGRRKGENKNAFDKGYVEIHWPSQDVKVNNRQNK